MKLPIISALILACLAPNAFAFGPCQKVMPNGMSYLPAVKACDGKAAIVLSGKYLNAFSAVVRDCNNNDRDPCHSGEDSCGTNASSPFKTQKTYQARILSNNRVRRATVHCLGEAGDSKVYRLVRRITVKLRNPVRSPSDILKVCLSTRTNAVRPVEVLSTYGMRRPAQVGYNRACETQRYLGCSIEYADICPKY